MPTTGPEPECSQVPEFQADSVSTWRLTVAMHTNGGPATFTGAMHSALPRLLDEIALDRNNQILVLAGTGDRFMTEIDGPSLGTSRSPSCPNIPYLEGRRIPQRLVDLEMPIVTAVNGPATVHSEYALLGDVVIASETTMFSDFPHLTFDRHGRRPARRLGGGSRAQPRPTPDAHPRVVHRPQALQWGAVAEVVPQAEVLRRAEEIAEQLAARPQLLNRHIAVTIRQRLSRRIAEGTALGLSLEGMTAVNLPFVQQG